MSIIDIPTGKELATLLQPIMRRQIRVRGIVQGVGFRPFVYNLARSLGLRGFVLNTSAGVIIEVEGAEGVLDRFLAVLTAEPPPLAQIEDVSTVELEPTGEQNFTIRESKEERGPVAAVPADVATCEECQRDFSDPHNRRNNDGEVPDVSGMPRRI
jgi:hydrogenase maturation protein HypF